MFLGMPMTALAVGMDREEEHTTSSNPSAEVGSPLTGGPIVTRLSRVGSLREVMLTSCLGLVLRGPRFKALFEQGVRIGLSSNTCFNGKAPQADIGYQNTKESLRYASWVPAGA